MNAMTVATAQSRILTLPNRPPFMLDSDLAEFYGTRTDLINTAVKRNPGRFPERFAFRITESEFTHLTTQNAFSSGDYGHGGRRYLPMAFSHAGAYALSAVLKSPRAVEVSVMVFEAFAAIQDTSKALARKDATMLREQLSLSQAQLAAVRQFVLAEKPLWSKIERYRALGYNPALIADLIGRGAPQVYRVVAMLEQNGVFAPMRTPRAYDSPPMGIEEAAHG